MMNNIKTIVTHPGLAHRDDVLAVAVSLAVAPSAKVFRRIPTAEDLASETTLVLDVGGQLEPSKFNFDHHQDREEGRCALSLLLEEGLGYDRLLLEAAIPGLEVIDAQDLFGPVATAKSRGVSPSVYAELTFSAPERTLIQEFSKVKSLDEAPTWVQGLLEATGRMLLASVQEEKEVRSDDAAAAVKDALSKHGMLDILDLRETTLNLPFALRVIAHRGLETPHVIVTTNPRGGVTLTRNQAVNPACMDFRRISGAEGVTFVHANGFMAVVEGDATTDVLPRILEALSPEMWDV